MKKSVTIENIKTKQILTNQQTKALKGGEEAVEIIIEDTQTL